jgi:response regulator of citrate/malate metabolism
MPAAGETTTTIEQLVVIDTLLARPGGATIEEMQERMRCCRRTVWRRLSWMADTFGVAVKVEPGFAGVMHYRYARGEAGVFRDEVRHART